MSGNFNDNATECNNSGNHSIAEVVDVNIRRRNLLQSVTLASLPTASFMQLFSGSAMAATKGAAATSFKRVAVSAADEVRVPEGYRVDVLYRWGDAIGAPALPVGEPAFKPDASNTVAEQMLQAGMHHDGMHFFPLPLTAGVSARGLLAINHEYTDDGLLHVDGMNNWSAEKVAKSQAAHGVSIIEVAQRNTQQNKQWEVVRPSPFARRITANTPMRISGPAKGASLLKTATDPEGSTVLGTMANCAHGYTPWGTYLTCEENWNLLFSHPGEINEHERRYGLSAKGGGYRWAEFDPRFDARANPNEPNRFGWVVEIDPMDPKATPVKRTALGRIKHESATLSQAPDGRVVFYMGDDERSEYIYKFVSRDKWNPKDRAANRDLLDHGTLYVARFDGDGKGRWLPLVHGQGVLTVANGFADQAEVLVKTRQAADALGATTMDRPEWIAVHPTTREVYCTLTNHAERGSTRAFAVNAANPRARNRFGHIIRWREKGQNPAATEFDWDIFVLAGDPNNADPNSQGNIKGDLFAAPDGLSFDAYGRLWIQTDMSGNNLNRGDYSVFGNNQLLVADIQSGECKRFLTGPAGCEITGIITSQDGKSLFVNIQHPGEIAAGRNNDPQKPQAVSIWPDGSAGGRPRSATIVISRVDGGMVGT